MNNNVDPSHTSSSDFTSQNLLPNTIDHSPIEDDVAATLHSLQQQPSSISSPMLSMDQFQQLLSTLTDTFKSHISSTQAKDDNPLAMVRLEHYISQGLSYKFDGDQEKLIPGVKKFLAMRSSALWHEATYITINNITYDLLVDFTKIKEHQIKAQAREHWTIENQIKSLKQDQPHLFYPRMEMSL
jgi:hypothetical protein